ncbi:MAG: hypothetical protein CHACPFDD_03548 [Phycisphaerae bacterium]|nr:hypothetical protein [Phycisphaerae bacterium]
MNRFRILPRGQPFCCAAALLGLLVGPAALGDDIPPIDTLSASGLPCGGAEMSWQTPFFEVGQGSQPSATYAFRYASIPITEGNWAGATVFSGDVPPVGVAFGATITLDLWVMAYSDGTTIYWDRAYLRGWLTVQLETQRLLPVGYGLRNEPIQFSIYRKSDNQYMEGGTSYTNSYGMAEYTSGDLTDLVECEMFTFKAYWAGHSIGLSQGSIMVSTGDREDSRDMYLCEGTQPVLTNMWNHWGGMYAGTLPSTQGAVQFQFTVPTEALATDTTVMLQPAASVPGNTGMNPGVPGASFAFQLEPLVYPLQRPIAISMLYPPGLMSSPYGVGESSLRGYWYNPALMRWELLDIGPRKLSREAHVITFQTDRFGLFAIAAESDPDHDGLGLIEEAELGTHPSVDDTDGDTVSDGDELWFTRGDPLDALKMSEADQHGTGQGLPGGSIYIACKIIEPTRESPVSNSVNIEIEPMALGDLNCDCSINGFDIEPFVFALLRGEEDYQQEYPDCDFWLADCNVDGSVNGFDIDKFVQILIGG